VEPTDSRKREKDIRKKVGMGGMRFTGGKKRTRHGGEKHLGLGPMGKEGHYGSRELGESAKGECGALNTTGGNRCVKGEVHKKKKKSGLGECRDISGKKKNLEEGLNAIRGQYTHNPALFHGHGERPIKQRDNSRRSGKKKSLGGMGTKRKTESKSSTYVGRRTGGHGS